MYAAGGAKVVYMYQYVGAHVHVHILNLHAGRCKSLQCETSHMLTCPQLQPSFSVFMKCP